MGASMSVFAVASQNVCASDSVMESQHVCVQCCGVWSVSAGGLNMDVFVESVVVSALTKPLVGTCGESPDEWNDGTHSLVDRSGAPSW